MSDESVLDQILKLKAALQEHNVPPPHEVRMTRARYDTLCREVASTITFYPDPSVTGRFVAGVNIVIEDEAE